SYSIIQRCAHPRDLHSFPTRRSSDLDVQPHLASSGQGTGVGFRRGKLRSFLVVAEVALSIVLLIGAGLLMRSFLILTRVDLGFKDRKSTRLNSSHVSISYAVFCLKKK